jgi:hypothetical protein
VEVFNSRGMEVCEEAVKVLKVRLFLTSPHYQTFSLGILHAGCYKNPQKVFLNLDYLHILYYPLLKANTNMSKLYLMSIPTT